MRQRRSQYALGRKLALQARVDALIRDTRPLRGCPSGSQGDGSALGPTEGPAACHRKNGADVSLQMHDGGDELRHAELTDLKGLNP